MSVNYTRINWEDTPSTQTPINAENLNAMDSAIDDLAGAVNEMDGVTEDVEDLQTEIASLKNDLNQFPNGTYPNMSVGNADQLTATVGIEDNAPYLFRTSGGSNDIGDREDVKKVAGVSVPWNQLAKNPVSPNWNGYRGTLSYSDGVITYTNTSSGNGKQIYQTNANPIPQNHVVFSAGEVKCAKATTVKMSFGVAGLPAGTVVIIANAWNTLSRIDKFSSQASNEFSFYIDETDLLSTNDVFELRMPQLVDLTLAFGTAIADYVYSLEQATAGAGVAWLKKHFPAQFNSGYQAYDAGSLQSVSGLTEHRMVGFNQWDEEYEVGAYASNDGSKVASNDRIRSKNFIPILPETTYYSNKAIQAYFYDANHNYIDWRNYPNAGTFVTLPNAYYMTFNCMANSGAVYNHDICINFHWDGEKDGTYEPYKTWSYALDDSVVIRGIPKVDASGNLYYDGDEYLPDGTVNRRYGIVDLGTLNWLWGDSDYNIFRSIIPDLKIESDYDGRLTGLICDKYITDTVYSISSAMGNKTMKKSQANIYIRDLNYDSPATFKTAMSGVYLVYELATPTTETALPYQETQIVDDFGTEEYVLADGAFPVPVGHDTMYQNNLRAKLEMSPDSPDGDGLYVVQQESGENTYVPLASTATIQDILTRLTALENA